MSDSHAETNELARSSSPFTAEQRAMFGKDDIEAGRMIVGLMGGIFTVGVFLYAIVAYVVWS